MMDRLNNGGLIRKQPNKNLSDIIEAMLYSTMHRAQVCSDVGMNYLPLLPKCITYSNVHHILLGDDNERLLHICTFTIDTCIIILECIPIYTIEFAVQ